MRIIQQFWAKYRTEQRLTELVTNRRHQIMNVITNFRMFHGLNKLRLQIIKRLFSLVFDEYRTEVA
jgi:hypothetical protein